MHRLPLLALGRMDGRQDQVVLVEQRRARLGRWWLGRIEREFGQEALARRRSRRRAAPAARRRRAASPASSCMRSRCGRYQSQRQLHVGRPGGRGRAQRCVQRDEARPLVAARAAGGTKACQRAPADRPPRPWRRAAARRSPARCPESAAATRKPAMRPRGFCAKRSTASTSLTCAASRNLRPPNLTNGMLRRASSSSSAALWCAARNSTACDFSAMPRLALRPARWSATQRACCGLVGAPSTSCGCAGRGLVGPQVLGVALARRAAITAFDAVEDRLRRAVVALERDEARRRLNCCGKSRMLRTVAPRNE